LFDIAETIDAREQQATFYTPPALATSLADDALARIFATGSKPPGKVRVLDPACGSGAFLVAAYRHLRVTVERDRGHVIRTGEREALLTGCIFGADLDERALGIARVQLLEEAELSKRRLPSLTNNLFLGDALVAPPGSASSPNSVPWQEILDQHGPFDCVLTNPPFGAQAKLPERLSIAAIRELTQIYTDVSAFGADYAYMFLSLARRLTGPDATAGFVMPRTLLNQRAGIGARRLLADWGISGVCDLRGAKVFRGVGAAICTIVTDPRTRTTNISGLRDSRISAARALDALDSGATIGPAVRRKRSDLGCAVKDGWTPFRLRWRDLREEIDKTLARLSDEDAHLVRTGVKPARVSDFVLPPDMWRERNGAIYTNGVDVPAKYIPHVVRSGDLKPFRLTLSGDRLFLPFDSSGKRVTNPHVLQLLRKKGGLPRNYQHGDLSVLLGPKILLSGVAREPAAAADPNGEYVPMMRGVHAVALRDLKPDDLQSVAVMLHGAFYQWLLRGLGAPRADESVEVTAEAIGQLPWPRLRQTEIKQLRRLGEDIASTLTSATDLEVIYGYETARAHLDEYVFDLVGATDVLRVLIRRELVRIA
jgi:SAM-dependent methyltransferase